MVNQAGGDDRRRYSTEKTSACQVFLHGGRVEMGPWRNVAHISPDARPHQELGFDGLIQKTLRSCRRCGRGGGTGRARSRRVISQV